MITIISGTNRNGSNTLKIAREYQLMFEEKGIKANLLSLLDFDMDSNTVFEEKEAEILIPTTHFVIVAPEYNGSIPGVLKTLIDKSRIQMVWHHKKAMLVGVANGRAGNLRGLDDLSNILNHIKVTVFPNKLPISSVNKLVDTEGKIHDAGTRKAISQQVDEFIFWAELNPEPEVQKQ